MPKTYSGRNKSSNTRREFIDSDFETDLRWTVEGVVMVARKKPRSRKKAGRRKTSRKKPARKKGVPQEGAPQEDGAKEGVPQEGAPQERRCERRRPARRCAARRRAARRRCERRCPARRPAERSPRVLAATLAGFSLVGLTGDNSRVADVLLEFARVLTPILTLLIGFYFGRQVAAPDKQHLDQEHMDKQN